MPSSHTMNSLVLNGYAVYFLLKRDYVPPEAATYLYAAVCAWTLWIGLARIYMGLHTPIDVAGGLTAGVVTLGAYISVDGADFWPRRQFSALAFILTRVLAVTQLPSLTQIRLLLWCSTVKPGLAFSPMAAPDRDVFVLADQIESWILNGPHVGGFMVRCLLHWNAAC